MKRPVGVILSCIVLGVLAALQLLSAAGMAFVGVIIRRGLATPPASAPTAPPPSFVVAAVLAIAFFSLVLAGWSIATLVGLASLRNWARYSVLVIGGCMAGFGTLAILGTVMAATVMPQAAPTPNLPPHTMQVILALYGFLYAIVVAIGVWWLVYFNQRKTKAYFLPQYATEPALYPPPYLSGYPAAYPGSYPAPYAGVPPPQPYVPAAPSSRAPTAIIVLACLFLFGSLSCLLITVLPMPGFFLGFVIARPGSIFLYLAFAIVSGLIGAGFLRLDNRARLLCYAYMAVGLVNFVVLITPWGQARYAVYNQLIFAAMHVPGPPPASPFGILPMAIATLVFCLALNGVVVWILHRYRYAFLKQSPPPTDPLKTPLVL